MSTAGLVTVWLLAAACGRIDFAASTDATTDALKDDALKSDAVKSDASSLPAWHLVQVQSMTTGSASGSASVASTLTPTTAGDLLVVGVQSAPGTTISSLSDNAPAGTSTFSAVAGSLATNSGQVDGDIELWYTPSVNDGATAVTAATTSASVFTVVVWELATAQPATVDSVKELSDQASSTMPAAPVVTTTKPGELVIAIAVSANNVTGIDTGNEFTNDTAVNQDGWAHITSTTAAAGSHQAVWVSAGTGTYCSTAVAFHVGE